jgi:hypothetical protein
MDSVAFVLQNGKEFCYRKGALYAEHGKEQNKEYDSAFHLVAPTSMAPRILLISLKK